MPNTQIEAVLVEKHTRRHARVLFVGTHVAMANALSELVKQWHLNRKTNPSLMELDRQGDDIVACYSRLSGDLLFTWQILDLRNHYVME